MQIFSIMRFIVKLIVSQAYSCVSTQQGTVNSYINAGRRQGLCHQENYTWSHTLIL